MTVMNFDQARGLMNQLLYPIDGAPDLSDATAALLAGNLIDGKGYSPGVADFAAAIDATLREGRLHPQAVKLSRRYTEPEMLDFIRVVAQRLDERKPWPPPRFVKVDVGQWGSLGEAVPIARVNRPAHQINAAIGYSFDQVQAGEKSVPALIVRLRTGDLVALMGDGEPRSLTFTLLCWSGEAAEVTARFRELTGFRPDDVVAI